MAYPYEHIAAILALFAAPALATVAFLVTPFARRRRIAPWLLAPIVYVGVALVSVILAINLGYLEP